MIQRKVVGVEVGRVESGSRGQPRKDGGATLARGFNKVTK